ncbi:MAG: glycosyltransferase [Desulfobacterales bacterium]|mgnify:FL=1|jgi:hypothetical protein|nr:glycosyltransferase [Desulfobacteraceae bacterium]MBT4363941.1 glycosyltransferase [Desulfobacteraceae bacterium]MBT7085149.1 glycosyltransferase [Desulfobacterales bacterium]
MKPEECMKIDEIQHHNYIAFGAVSFLMLCLCILGGFFGDIGKPILTISLNILRLEKIEVFGGLFIILYSVTWCVSIALFMLFPRRVLTGRGVVLIFFLALIFRIALIPHTPSDDINRYLWEGRMINEGVNPYLFSPDSDGVAEYANDDPFHEKINHPNVPAAYPPFILLLFSMSNKISYSSLMIKAVIILFDVGTIWFLIQLLIYFKMNIRWVVLYAFNPLILYGFAGHGHIDAIQVFFLTGSLFFYYKRLWGIMFLFAGLAVQSKYIAVVTIPFLINRDNIKYLWVAAAAVIVPYVPLVYFEWSNPFYGIIEFGSKFAFNGSIHGILRAGFGGIKTATTICSALLAFSLIFGLIFFHPELSRKYDKNPVTGMFFSIGAVIVFMPTVHFWYVSWVIPFLVLRPSISWLLLTLTISGYFTANGIAYHTGRWVIPLYIQIIEWLPFYVFFASDIYRFYKRVKMYVYDNPPESISVVIPTKNESENITECINNILTDRSVIEIIVVDSGSQDLTTSLAEEAGAMVVNHNVSPENGGGRGGQIYAGISAARGDVVVIVHADAKITSPDFENVIHVLAKNPDIIGGAIGGIFNDYRKKFRILEFLNDFKTAFMGLSFGDQVQFFRRKPIVEKKQFPDVPLMEDVEFSLRLNKLGRQVYLFGNVLLSARRWNAKGFIHSLTVIKLVATYMIQRIFFKPDTLAMYRKYYK